VEARNIDMADLHS